MEVKILKYREAEQLWRNFNAFQYRLLVQHTWAWQRMLHNWEGLEWSSIALLEKNQIIAAIPFCVKTVDNIGKVLMSSPLPASYGGVLHITNINIEIVYKTLLLELLKFAEINKIDIISIFTSPFRDDIDYYRKYLQPDYITEKFYQYLNKDILNTKLHGKIKNNINRSLNKRSINKCYLQWSTKEQDLYEWYNEVLKKRFADKGIEPVEYNFFKSMFNELLPEGLIELSFIRDFDGNMITGGLFLYGWCQDIFLRASNDKGIEYNLGLGYDYDMLLHAFSKGIDICNFQSSPSKLDSSYMYKKHFCCIEKDNYYICKIFNKDIFKKIKDIDEIKKAFPYFYIIPFEKFNEVKAL